MPTIKRLLVRLYPRAWRDRYGEEFTLLLEATPVTPAVVANVVAAAAREWILRSFIGRLAMGPVLAYAALLTAEFLTAAVPAEPTIALQGGLRLVTPPWPVALGYIHSILGFAVLGRMALNVWPGLRIGSAEFVCWLVALFAGSVTQQWALMVMNTGTSVAPWSHSALWSLSAVSVTSNLMFLFLASRNMLAMPKPQTTRAPYSVSSRPLGLS